MGDGPTRSSSRSRANLPRAIARRNTWWAVVAVAGFAFFAILMFWLEARLQRLGQSFAAVLAFAPGVVLFVLAIWHIRRADARLRERLDETGDRLCPNCLYDLSRSHEAGRCPECGRPYDSATVREAWEAYRISHRNDGSGYL